MPDLFPVGLCGSTKDKVALLCVVGTLCSMLKAELFVSKQIYYD
jgi:hypothetical protein